MSKATLSLMVVLMLAFAGSAIADIDHSLHFMGVPAPTQDWGGYYVGPYNVQDETTPTADRLNGGVVMSTYCDDFTREMVTYWTADDYLLGYSDVASYKFSHIFSTNPTAATAYLAAAYLVAEAETPSVNRIPYQVAVWLLFDPGLQTQVNNDLTYGATINADLADALTWAGTHTVLNLGQTVHILTPEPPDASQELIWFGPSLETNVPEPATFFLVGLVLVGCGRALARRRV